MKYLKPIVSLASAAVLACTMSGPAAFLPHALAAEGSGVVRAMSSASAGSSEEGAVSSSSESSSEAESGEGEQGGQSKTDEGKEGQKPESRGGSGSSASKDSGKGGASASKGGSPKASEKKATDRQARKSEKEKKAEKKAEESKKKKGSDKPKASGQDPAKYAARLSGLASKLDAVPDEFGSAKNIAKSYKSKLAKVSKKKTALQKEQQRAQNVLDEMQRELAAGTDATLEMVISGRADFDSIDSRSYLLKKVADGSAERIQEIASELTKLDRQRAELKKREAKEMSRAVKDRKATVEKLIAKGNAIAAKIERNVSLMKYAEPDLSASRAALRETSLAAAAKWYEFEDAMAGNDDVLTFGAGADFDLSKKSFVKKWGAAIDAFYKNNYPGSPLEGQGSAMAESAWKHKIDPRLCAAVSIIESTGGRYCIKPHNAWGWGAADSDPYGGASGWGSWAEAIEAWHNGLATSTTGLATAPTVEELGEIYCSSLDWAAKVAGEMQKISAEAK